MARAIMRLRRIDNGKIYHVAKAGSSKRELCPQQSPRCVPALLISDSSCSLSSELEIIVREEIEKIVDALKTMLEKTLCERLGPCANHRCDGQKIHGRRAARRIYHFSNRKLDPNTGTRLLYYQSRILKNRLFEKKKAEWYREGPPNIKEICHTIRTAA